MILARLAEILVTREQGFLATRKADSLAYRSTV
jgi:hypothetical protein